LCHEILKYQNGEFEKSEGRILLQKTVMSLVAATGLKVVMESETAPEERA
jgi:hypothetical protein